MASGSKREENSTLIYPTVYDKERGGGLGTHAEVSVEREGFYNIGFYSGIGVQGTFVPSFIYFYRERLAA